MNLIIRAARRVCYALVAVAVVVGLAACGASTTTSTTGSVSPTATTGSGAFAARRAQIRACLRSHGVTLPARPAGPGALGSGAAGSGAPGSGAAGSGIGAPPGAGGGFFRRAFANPKVRAALQACGARFGAGGFGRGRFRLSPTAITNYVACVDKHGYKLPKPNLTGTGPVFPPSIRTNKRFLAASQACRSLLVPSGAPPGSGSSSQTSTTSTT